MTTLSDAELETAAPIPAPGAPQGALERVPLPWFIKKRVMDAYLRDVHHYLFDVEYAPPGRAPAARIQQTIRRRFVATLGAPAVSRPHIVVSHSMGTVIAYDCLKRVGDCAPVDGLMTLGSPLGLDEIQDKLQPGWSRADGFPHERVAGDWVNVFDRLDPVCGFDPVLASDFRKGGQSKVEDIAVQNDGAWRHSITKYLRQKSVATTLRRMLRV
jgi:pimeloyl-ACP methyl ester carboxylesterase